MHFLPDIGKNVGHPLCAIGDGEEQTFEKGNKRPAAYIGIQFTPRGVSQL